MVLNRNTTRVFYQTLYASELETITLQIRGFDQLQGTVTSYLVFNARHSMFYHVGESIQGGMGGDDHCVWHIPRVELERVGVQVINNDDRIIDVQGRTWQPEAGNNVIEKLWRNHICIECRRADPPPAITN